MDSLNKTNFETDFDQKITEPIILKFNEALKICKTELYHDYINDTMQSSNRKWLYPTLTSVLAMEFFSVYRYIFKILSSEFVFRTTFLACIGLYTAYGYAFYKMNREEKTTQKNNYIILSFLSLFILMQYFFYYAGSASTQSLFYFFAASVAVGILPSINPRTLTFMLAANLGMYLTVTSKYHSGLINNTYFYNSIFISAATYFLSIYFYVSRVNILISSKKITSFAKDMAISNDKLNSLNTQLEKMSLTDSLTKIGNRRYFEIEMEKVWSHAMRSKTSVTIMLLDIDFFKLYNDYFGHPKGDICIAEVAQAIKSSFMRKSDIVARYGGEEFVVVLPCVDYEQARMLAERLVQNIRALKLDHPRSTASPYVSVSIGISTVMPERGMDYKAYFNEADKALYLAKQTGRNKFCTLKSNEKALPPSKKKLKKSDELSRLKAIIQNSSVCYFNINYETKKIEFSEGIKELVDIENTKLNSYLDFYKFVFQEDVKTLDAFINKFFETGFSKAELEFRVVNKNEQLVWIKVSCSMIKDTEDSPLEIAGTFSNFDNEIHNTHIINNLLDGNYIINLESGTSLVFGGITNLLNCNKKQKYEFENLENALYFEEKDIFKSFINDVKLKNFPDLNFEYRIKTKDNQIIWLSSRNRIYNDSDGNPFLIVGLIYNLWRLDTYNKSLKSEINVSPVSGLPDRTKFIDDLEEILSLKGSCGYLFLMDIDNFNNVNNIFSYSEGNKFLKHFGMLLNEHKLFQGDVYHFDGDLFAIVFPNLKREQAIKQMEVFRDLAEIPIECRGISYQYSLSISCIEYPLFGSSVEDLLRNCDIALHKIKIGGKNDILVFSNDLYEENITRLSLEMELRRSVENNMDGFILYYHPLLSAEDNICIGAEALIRWRSSEGRIYAPGEFIPSLENAGLMNKVGEWVLKTASSQCKRWLEEGGLDNMDKLIISETFSMSINISAHQLVSDFFEENLLNHLYQIELDCKHITLEITESALIMDIQKGIKVLSSLRRKGIKIAIDDFGTGYSSLSYFRELPVDEIKIDRSFITDIENDNFCKEFVNSIIKITQSINRVICVEGVENETQAEILRGFNADILQGFLYSKPIPTTEFEIQFLK